MNTRFAPLCFLLMWAYCLKADPLAICVDNLEESKVLTEFFKMGVEEEEYGYVLMGAKPISVRNFYGLDQFPISNQLKREESQLMKTLLARAAIPIWERLYSGNKNFAFKVTPAKVPDSIEGGLEVQFINVAKLREVTKKNIDLFRYVLGPSLSVDQIVNNIIYSRYCLIDTLQQDLVLMGIVLGFGSYNSLVGGRVEEILSASFSKDHPPFFPKSFFLQKRGAGSLDFLSPEGYGSDYLDLAGGGDGEVFKNHLIPFPFNPIFSNIEQELLSLDSLEASFPSHLRESPAFIFAAFKEGPSNKPLFDLLQQTQKQIQTLLKAPDFLAQVLEKIGGKKPRINADGKALSHSFLWKTLKPQQWAYIISSAAKQFENKEDQWKFVQAFCQPSNSSQTPPPMMGVSRLTLEGLKISRQHLSKADTYFGNLSKNPSMQEVVSTGLYFKTTLQGSGKKIKGTPQIRLHYVIEDTEGKVIFADYNAWVWISQTILGFSHGIQGMKIGEKRTLFVHPSFGYGALTTFPPCIGLVIKMHLLEIGEESFKDLPHLKPIDLNWIKDPLFYKSIEETIEQKPSFCGSFYRGVVNQFEHLDKKVLIDQVRKNFSAPIRPLELEKSKSGCKSCLDKGC